MSSSNSQELGRDRYDHKICARSSHGGRLTGATDLVADGERLVTIGNGHALMAKVTALGCAESALIAAVSRSNAMP